MATITDITAQKKKKDRVNIFLDGSYYCSMDALTIAKNRIKIGDEVDEETLSALQNESESSFAFEKAVKYISIRMRTQKEIRQYLREKGYLSATIDEVVSKLIEYRLISDESFCREYIRSYANRDGVKKIRLNLKRLGISDEIIENELALLDGQEEEAFLVAEKYLRTHKKADIMKIKNHLYQRGFESDDISSAVSRIREEYFEGEDEEW